MWKSGFRSALGARLLSALGAGLLALPIAGDACSRGATPPPPATRAPAPPASIPLLGADSGPAPSLRKDLNVVLITIDCLRADMPWAGYERPIAPRLTELAKGAVVYTSAYSLSSYTSMSVGGLLSGRLPGELDRDGYFFGTYGNQNLFFPERLQAAGIRTVSAHAHGYFKNSGLAQGFDVWELVPDLKWDNLTDENVTSPRLEQIAEKLLGDPALAERRFFAWFHFVDPHDRYMAHSGIDWGPKLRDRYDAEVTFTDEHIGKLVDFVRARPYGARTAFIVTSDHGEAFGEHKQFLHGFELWEPLVRVPLFFVVPGAAAHQVKANRGAIDLAPTILELLGVPQEPTFRGKSLVAELFAGPGTQLEERDVLVDLPATSDNERRRALISGRHKLIAYGGAEYAVAFDLDADPGEDKPQPRGPLHDEMLAKYKQRTKDIHDVASTKCREGCLGGAYAKPALGADAGARKGE